eukprot:7960146-Karenia_brevis.AAC.1
MWIWRQKSTVWRWKFRVGCRKSGASPRKSGIWRGKIGFRLPNLKTGVDGKEFGGNNLDYALKNLEVG